MEKEIRIVRKIVEEFLCQMNHARNEKGEGVVCLELGVFLETSQ